MNLEPADSFEKSSKIADLVEDVKALDINKCSVSDIEEFFSEYEETEELKGIRENVVAIKRLREENSSDKDLAEKIWGFRPIGPLKIELTPFAIIFHFPNPLDFNKSLGKTFHTVGGFSDHLKLRVGDKDVVINVISLSILKTESMKVHEVRHAINYSLKAASENAVLEDTLELNEWSEAATLINEFDEVIKKAPADRVGAVVEYQNLRNIKKFRNELLAKFTNYFASSSSQLSITGMRISLAHSLYTENHAGISKKIEKILSRSFGFSEEEIQSVKDGIEKYNRKQEIEKATSAMQILLQKGYDQSWILSYLAAGENFLADWEQIARRTPRKGADWKQTAHAKAA